MIKSKYFAALTIAAILAGCSWDNRQEITGTVVDKEYEARNCEKLVKGKCKQWDPAEYELTIKRDDGTEVELVVTQYDYNGANQGDTGTWKGKID